MSETDVRPVRRRHIPHWNPEDRAAWEAGGRRVARRNLVASVLSEHVGFSVWTMWSVLVLFLSPSIGFGFDASEKFVLVLVPTLVGAAMRLPYSYAVIRFGGRRWTIFASAVLLVPAVLAWWFVQQPGTPLWVFLLIAALAGVGGGNFASSMTNIAAFFPRREQGWALGINAGGGNLGVAAVQLVGLLVVSVAGTGHPSHVAAVYLPLIVLVTLVAALRMDDVDTLTPDPGALRRCAAEPHTWWISLLYVGTFGSFIGYGFAFGLVLQNQFGADALQGATYTFLGPLVGSLARPLGGRLADRCGGARVTLLTFGAMAVGTMALLGASATGSFGAFVAAFTVLFVLSGIGNGSTYKMIPAVCGELADRARHRGVHPDAVERASRSLSGSMIGVAGAIGALGGVAVTLAFLGSFAWSGTGAPAVGGFLAVYLVCGIVVYRVYLRPGRPAAKRTESVAGV